jgi:hypothetical protein
VKRVGIPSASPTHPAEFIELTFKQTIQGRGLTRPAAAPADRRAAGPSSK